MKMNHRKKKLGLFLTLTTGILMTACAVAAQTGGLRIGGSSANFGQRSLSGGFLPDPVTVRIVSGGSVAVNTLGLAPGCDGFVTREPDFILDYDDPAGMLRFYALTDGDTTLVVNDANGRWHCNDDSFGGLNPTVDIRNPPAGQYDVWVGSYSRDEGLSGRLHITELSSQHP